MSTSKFSFAAVAAGCTALCTMPVEVSAQQEAAQTRGVLEEVVVTARRREESLQDVPIAISAFGSVELESRGIIELNELNAVAPNVSLRGGFATGEAEGGFRVRGIPGVAVYVDGVWQSTSDGMFTLGVVEVDRIEVLRGPQGTLYGKNAVGGAIQYVTRPPADEFGARVNLTAGNYNRRDISASVDLPLSDTLRTKFTAASLFRDGFVHSLEVDRSWGDFNDQLLRGDILWEPNPDFSARFVAERSSVDRWGPPRVLMAMREAVYDPQTGTNTNPRAQAYINIGIPFSNQTHAAGFPGGEVGKRQNRSTWEGRGLVVDLDRMTLDLQYELNEYVGLRSISSYREHYRAVQTDFDASNISIVERDFRAKGRQFTQEFQVLGQRDRLSWVGGLFYWDDRDDDRTWTWVMVEFRDPAVQAEALAGGQGAGGFGPPVTLDSLTRVETDGWAVFGDATWEFTDQLSLSLGARYQDEDLTSGARSPLVAPPVLPGTSVAGNDFASSGYLQSYSTSFDSFTWRAALQYQINSDVMVYGSYSEGFSAGGIDVPNLPAFPDVPETFEYEPETLRNFEVGLRADWLDGRLRTNLTGFFSKYSDIQVDQYIFSSCDGTGQPGSCDGPRQQLPNLHQGNAAEAEVTGVELEALMFPTPEWRLNANIGYLDAKYTTVGTAVDPASIFPGAPFPGAPEWTVSLGGQYEHTLRNGGTVTPRLDYTWTDRYTLASDARNMNFQSAYGLLNARLTYASPGRDWSVTAFGSNLTDEYYMNSGFFSDSFYLDFVTLGRPREYGVTFSFHF